MPDAASWIKKIIEKRQQKLVKGLILNFEKNQSKSKERNRKPKNNKAGKRKRAKKNINNRSADEQFGELNQGQGSENFIFHINILGHFILHND